MNLCPKCLYCDKPIRKAKATTKFGEGYNFPERWLGYGWPNDSNDIANDAAPYFCSLRCGMYFGAVLARGGARMSRDGKTLTGGLR